MADQLDFDELDWEFLEDEPLPAPSCDLENPEICESCT